MKRQIEITLEQAQKFYQQGGALKEIALLAFTEKELSENLREKLKTLVGLRFTQAELERKINEIFGTELVLHHVKHHNVDFEDYFFFVLPNEYDNYELYYIETKNGKCYITEVVVR